MAILINSKSPWFRVYCSCGASFSYVINSLDLLFSFFKRNVFSLVLILILLPHSFTLLFSCDQPQIETTLPFAYQTQGWT